MSDGLIQPAAYTFRVADFNIRIVFETMGGADSILLLPSFMPFVADDGVEDDNLLFKLTVEDRMRLSAEGVRIGCSDTGNGRIIVYDLPGGGHQYIFKNTGGDSCCLLKTNSDFSRCRCALNGDEAMRAFGLNNAIMLAFAFASCPRHTLLVHASCVVFGGRAYPFIAASGTGKSTHSSLWMQNIDGVQLLNDDNPAIRITEGGDVMVYGTPWSGKTPCYRQRKYPLGAVTRIERAPANSIVRMSALHAFAALLPACSSMKWDGPLHGMLCDTLGKIIERIPVYTMRCRPDNEAALICHKKITEN